MCAYRCVFSAKEMRTLPHIAVTMPMRLDHPVLLFESSAARWSNVAIGSRTAELEVAGMYMVALRK